MYKVLLTELTSQEAGQAGGARLLLDNDVIAINSNSYGTLFIMI